MHQQQRQTAAAIDAPEFGPADGECLHVCSCFDVVGPACRAGLARQVPLGKWDLLAVFFSSSFLRKRSSSRRMMPRMGFMLHGLGLIFDGIGEIALAEVDVGQRVEVGRLVGLQFQRLPRTPQGLVEIALRVADQPGVLVAGREVSASSAISSCIVAAAFLIKSTILARYAGGWPGSR